MDTSTQTERGYNFSAGPAILPEPVLDRIKDDVWNIEGTGIGVLEHSHRGPIINRVFEEAEERCRQIGSISEDYEILFLPGGATLQFAMIPMNFLPDDAAADYLDTGVWANKAIKEARFFGNVNVSFDGSSCNYDHVPSQEEMNLTPGAAYLHYCSNNTIMGTRFSELPETDAPLVCDASSEFFARPMHIDKHAIVYGGAQKNLGPSGVALVIIRKDMIERACRDVPSMLDYNKHAKAGSRLNTPPVFGVYCMNLVFEWILAEGGLEVIAARNTHKASLIYDAIDGSNGFYRGFSRTDCRSEMNITFRFPSEELDRQFIEEAKEHSMSNLAGYRTVGGIRTSIYNAFPVKGCEVLVSFMNDFAARNG